MITLILTIVGAFLGGSAFGVQGVVFGAVAGFAVGNRHALSSRLQRLEAAIEELKRRGASAQQTDDSLSDRAMRARLDEGAEAPPVRPAPTQAAPIPRPPAAPAAPAPVAPRAPAAARPSAEPGRPADVPRPSAVTLRVHREPDFIRWLRVWFTTGNIVAKIGALILFIGVAFLLKYYAEHARVPIEVRLIGVCVGAVVLLGFGWRLRERQRGYALILQGVAVAVLYLVIFAALRLYALLPPTAAFVLLVAMGVFFAVLAIAQNSMMFAMMGAAGGFLAPILTSTGQGSHVVLFSYFALLDLGIVAIAWFKSWRPLNLLGFVFTFGIGTAWGVLKYRPEQLGTTEPFLILFFVLFVAIAILFAFRQAPKFTHYVDGTLVFGTPLIGFGLQSALVNHIPYALAYSAVAVAAFYLILARVLYGRHRENLRLLVEAFLALGVAFATLAIPLALDGRWTAAAWALEGVAILWVGLRQDRLLARVSGVLLQFGGGIAYGLSSSRAPELLPVLNSHFVGSLLVSGAGLVSGWLIHRFRDKVRSAEALGGGILFFWGLAWWLFAGVAEIDHSVATRFELSSMIAFVAFTALCLSIAAERLSWSLPRIPALCLLPVMLMLAVTSAEAKPHPFADRGWIAWLLAFAVFYRVLKQHDDRIAAIVCVLLHAAGLWLLAAILSAELKWVLDQALPNGGVWPVIAWAIVPATCLLLIPKLINTRIWPFSGRPEAYIGVAAIGFHVYLVLWSLFANLSSTGDAAPLPYVPLLNPLDVAQAFVFLAVISVMLRQRSLGVVELRGEQRGLVIGVMAVAIFVWLNAALLRTLHHWANVPFDFDVMSRSTLVQSSLSIFWTLLALSAMLWATRHVQRLVWFVGAALLGVVVLKLFFVDLSKVGTVARIASFVVVGLLMLVLGRPLRMPPAVARAAT